MKLISCHITSVAVSLVFLFPLLTLGQRAPLILSTYRYADNDRIKNIEPFTNYLSQTCQCAVVVKSYESVGAMLKAMDEAEPDVVFMNTFGYLLLPEQNKSYTPLAALRVAPDKKSTYQSILVANKSAHVSSLIELQHKSSELSLLLVNPGSTSGNLVPRLGLASAGMPNAELVFKKTDYSKNHLLTFQMVAAGNFDVGAFGSEEYDKAIKRDSSLADKVTILWRSGDIPLGPVVYKNNMSPGLKRCLNKALLNLHQNNNAALESVKAGWTEALPADRYVPINKSDYINWLKSYGEESVTIGIIKKFTN